MRPRGRWRRWRRRVPELRDEGLHVGPGIGLRGLIDALDYWADHIPGAPGKGKLNISFKWDDSIILDRLSEMAQWQQEVSMGLRSKTEYRRHFFGEDEETATRAVQAIQQEAGANDILKGVIDNGDG